MQFPRGKSANSHQFCTGTSTTASLLENNGMKGVVLPSEYDSIAAAFVKVTAVAAAPVPIRGARYKAIGIQRQRQPERQSNHVRPSPLVAARSAAKPGSYYALPRRDSRTIIRVAVAISI